MSGRVELAEVGNRLAPPPLELAAILDAIERELAAREQAEQRATGSTRSAWRFSGRSWDRHPAMERERPFRTRTR